VNFAKLVEVLEANESDPKERRYWHSYFDTE